MRASLFFILVATAVVSTLAFVPPSTSRASQRSLALSVHKKPTSRLLFSTDTKDEQKIVIESTSLSFPLWLDSWVPSESPKRWLCINGFCLVYSVLLLLAVALFGASNEGSTELMHIYLVYDFILCTIWIVETGLTVWWHSCLASTTPTRNSTHQSSSIWHILELCIAVYFFISSIYYLDTSWNDAATREAASEMLTDIGINIVIYLWMSFEMIKRSREILLQEQHVDLNGYTLLEESGYDETSMTSGTGEGAAEGCYDSAW